MAEKRKSEMTPTLTAEEAAERLLTTAIRQLDDLTDEWREWSDEEIVEISFRLGDLRAAAAGKEE